MWRRIFSLNFCDHVEKTFLLERGFMRLYKKMKDKPPMNFLSVLELVIC